MLRALRPALLEVERFRFHKTAEAIRGFQKHNGNGASVRRDTGIARLCGREQEGVVCWGKDCGCREAGTG